MKNEPLLVTETGYATNDNIDKIIKETIPDAAPVLLSQTKTVYRLPKIKDENKSASDELFLKLETESQKKHISSYSINSPTLEDIFLDIVSDADKNKTDVDVCSDAKNIFPQNIVYPDSESGSSKFRSPSLNNGF